MNLFLNIKFCRICRNSLCNVNGLKLIGYILIVISFFSASKTISAQSFNQDTIFINIPDAEQRFVNKNLTLLINQFNIDIAKANYLQAKLWYNPNLSYWQELYNPNNKEFLSYKDEHGVQLQQLFTIAGKHRATWKLSEVGVKQAQYQVADVLRNLKYELYSDISDLYYNQQLMKMYHDEEIQIKHL